MIAPQYHRVRGIDHLISNEETSQQFEGTADQYSIVVTSGIADNATPEQLGIAAYYVDGTVTAAEGAYTIAEVTGDAAFVLTMAYAGELTVADINTGIAQVEGNPRLLREWRNRRRRPEAGRQHPCIYSLAACSLRATWLQRTA